jgi:hypothetical protein
MQQIWILNEDENCSCHMEFVASQNSEFALGSLWYNFCHPYETGQQGPLNSLTP